MTRRLTPTNLFWAALAFCLVLAFDHAMTADASAHCGAGWESEGC